MQKKALAPTIGLVLLALVGGDAFAQSECWNAKTISARLTGSTR